MYSYFNTCHIFDDFLSVCLPYNCKVFKGRGMSILISNTQMGDIKLRGEWINTWWMANEWIMN